MKKYFLVAGETRIFAGLTPPVYDDLMKSYPVEGGQVAAFTPDAFVIEVEDVAVYRTVMTPIRFEEQFSIEEQLVIGEMRAYAGDNELALTNKKVLDLLFGKLKDVRLTEVDVKDASVIAGIDFCVNVGILTAERAATIKLGIPA